MAQPHEKRLSLLLGTWLRRRRRDKNRMHDVEIFAVVLIMFMPFEGRYHVAAAPTCQRIVFVAMTMFYPHTLLAVMAAPDCSNSVHVKIQKTDLIKKSEVIARIYSAPALILSHARGTHSTNADFWITRNSQRKRRRAVLPYVILNDVRGDFHYNFSHVTPNQLLAKLYYECDQNLAGPANEECHHIAKDNLMLIYTDLQAAVWGLIVKESLED
ncbi:hypothetical protein ANCDUO_16312 [Ancylostoma duodenale]|uniref:Uncharacterized protein n=1 Tax=Ancylostoma duodenale TaxID=51022 RepID=A0A0C2FY95_9BILA|nr:hypothetical protein ANCDUO_16312 [Ancylostoma duodenale]